MITRNKSAGRHGLKKIISETELIRLQVNRTVTLLQNNITRYYDALYELRRLTLILLAQQHHTPQDIDIWLEQEGFGVDGDGFWLNLPLLQQFRKGVAPKDAISHSWDPAIKDLEDARSRMYCLRDIGTFVQEIHSRLPGSAWIYYQDVTNTSIQFPYIDQVTAITPDFNWLTYHTFASVTPQANPERAIQWTPPSIDYAGEGVILSVSIPVYHEERFIGAWSIDLPMNTLYQDYIDESYLTGQENCIFDQYGNIIVHPSIEARIDKQKGSLFQQKLNILGGDFATLQSASLFRDEQGELRLKGRDGEELLAYYGTVPKIHWTFLVTVPRASLLDAVNRRIKTAFDKIMKGDFSYRIVNPQEPGHQNLLVEGYNKMAEALQQQEDIRRRAERALRESEKKYRLLFSNAHDSIFIIQEGRITFANPRTLEMSGYTMHELAFLPLTEMLHPEYREEVLEHYQRTLENATPETHTFKILNNNQEELWIHLNSVRITWEKIEATLHFARDITQQVQLEQQLHHAQKMDAIGKLASSVAHEFGNPLVGMRFAMRDILNRSYLKEEDATLLSMAEKECDRMRGLIRDLQRFNRPTSGRRTTFNLHHLLDSLFVFHRRLLSLNKVRLVQLYDEQDIIISAVEDQLRQVFINLILNAIDAMEENGGVLTILTAASPEKAIISIKDNGSGVKPEAMDHIFEPFFTTKSAVEGVGLGLPVSYGIVQAHNGEIAVRSKPGNTVFEVTLPL